MKTLHQWIIGLLCFSLGLSPNMVFAARGPCPSEPPQYPTSNTVECVNGQISGMVKTFYNIRTCKNQNEDDCSNNVDWLN